MTPDLVTSPGEHDSTVDAAAANSSTGTFAPLRSNLNRLELGRLDGLDVELPRAADVDALLDRVAERARRDTRRRVGDAGSVRDRVAVLVDPATGT